MITYSATKMQRINTYDQVSQPFLKYPQLSSNYPQLLLNRPQISLNDPNYPQLLPYITVPIGGQLRTFEILW